MAQVILSSVGAAIGGPIGAVAGADEPADEQRADNRRRQAGPQQVAADAEHFENQQHAAERQPVPEGQVLQIIPHGSEPL